MSDESSVVTIRAFQLSLIAQIPEERFRKGVAAEVKVLKKTKRFGLVFEEHLPETVRLPRLPVSGAPCSRARVCQWTASSPIWKGESALTSISIVSPT